MKGESVKMRQRSFSSSAVESETDSNTLTNECGASKECDKSIEMDIVDKLYLDHMTIQSQRRGSSPSKLSTDKFKRLSPPIVRVNSPPNNDDLDAVEKQLGDMLEATIASIESGARITHMESLADKIPYKSRGQLVDIDDDDSPLSFFTGSFNYFFSPKERYKTDSYDQPAQYSSWSSNISSSEEYTKNGNCQKRPNMRCIGRTKSLEPSWTTNENQIENVSEIQPHCNSSSPLSSAASGFDTEDQIDEYMMMLHSNPELFLASVRKGCMSSEVKNALNGNYFSPKRRRNKKPSMKELGRAQTLEPSWTPESSPTRNFHSNNQINEEPCQPRYVIDENVEMIDDYNPHALVRSTQSFPATRVNLSNPSIFNSFNMSTSNEAWTPSIIVTPPSSSKHFLSDFESIPQPILHGKKFRSKSLAPHVPIDELSSAREESIKLRKFLSQGNLIATSAMPFSSRELPSRILFENAEKRRYIDRYYMSISSRIFIRWYMNISKHSPPPFHHVHIIIIY